MIFLKDNALLEKKLTPDDIKNRLLGHWGTCPGLVLVYAHLNRIIRKTGIDVLYVVGPGLSVSNRHVLHKLTLRTFSEKDTVLPGFCLVSGLKTPSHLTCQNILVTKPVW